jgi:hypothetical protein
MSEILRKMHLKNITEGEGMYSLLREIEYDETKD